MIRRRFDTSAPIDLAATLAPLAVGRYDPSIRLAGNESWRAWRTPDGPATIRLVAEGRRVEARAWGPGASWALEHAPGLAGALDSLDGFEPAHPLVRDLLRRNPGVRLPRTATVTEVVVPTVLGQKVTGLEQRRSWERLVRRYGADAPGPGGLRLPPAPEDLAALPYHRFHPLGIERRRCEAIRTACSRARRLEETLGMSTPDAISRLVAFPGIGPWTAAIVCRLSRGDADMVETGDYNLPHLVSWNLAGEPRGSDERMLELLSDYPGHRARVVRLLELSGRRPPRRGPRMPVRRLEGI